MMKNYNVLIIWVLIITVMGIAGESAGQNLKVMKQYPAKVTGTLGYANMKYWVEVQKGPKNVAIAVWPDENGVLTSQLAEMVGKIVTLTGTIKVYHGGSKYLHVSKSGLSTSDVKTDNENYP